MFRGWRWISTSSTLILCTVLLVACAEDTGIGGGKANGSFHYGEDVEQDKQSQHLTRGTEGPTVKPFEVKVEKVLPAAVMLDAPLINQNPELHNGCEATSLTMMLQYAKVNVDKMTIAGQMKVDPAPLVRNKKGDIISWGNPNIGFVGDVTGARPGYAIYHGAIFPLAKTYLKTAVDLTKKPYSTLEAKLAENKPVMVWTTSHFDRPYRWRVWNTSIGPVRTTAEEHSVLLVGYDKNYVYVNDPLKFAKTYRVEKAKFRRGWEALGRQAISY